MTLRDSEAFEKSSSLFQGFLKFIDQPMCKRDEDIDLWSGNVQTQPWKFEQLKSGKDLVKIWLNNMAYDINKVTCHLHLHLLIDNAFASSQYK